MKNLAEARKAVKALATIGGICVLQSEVLAILGEEEMFARKIDDGFDYKESPNERKGQRRVLLRRTHAKKHGQGRINHGRRSGKDRRHE